MRKWIKNLAALQNALPTAKLVQKVRAPTNESESDTDSMTDSMGDENFSLADNNMMIATDMPRALSHRAEVSEPASPAPSEELMAAQELMMIGLQRLPSTEC